jgi:Recombination endonuclease VII
MVLKAGVVGVMRRGRGPGKRFMVDHHHASGRVRGLLCCNCNFIIGHCLENKAILERAIAYLEDK